MARPVMRDPNGRWSLVQVADAAGLTHRKARDLVEAGYLDRNDLCATDVLYARIGAAVIDAVRPAGQSRAASATAVQARNKEALALTRQALSGPLSDEAMLLITPTSVALHKKALPLAAALAEATEATLVVPLGKWADDLSNTLSSLANEDVSA